MKRTIVLFTVLMLIGSVSASSIDLKQNKKSVKLYPGESVNYTAILDWDGKAPVVAELSDNLTEEGITINYSENPLPVYPDRDKKVTIVISASKSAPSGEYLIGIEATTNYQAKQTSSGGDEPTVIDGGKETVIKYRNRTITVPKGTLNKSEEERIRQILEELNQSEQVQDRIIDNLRGNLSKTQIRNNRLEDKLTNTKRVIAVLGVVIAGLIVSMIALLAKKTGGVSEMIEDLSGAEE